MSLKEYGLNLCMKYLINADRFAHICLNTMNTVWCDAFGFILVRRQVISFSTWPKMMMIAIRYVLYSLSLVVFNVRLTIPQTKTDNANVMDAIFNIRGYNKKVLPRLNITTPVLLDIDLDFLGIDAINEISEIMTSSGFLGVSWKDTGLSWIPKYYGNLIRYLLLKTIYGNHHLVSFWWTDTGKSWSLGHRFITLKFTTLVPQHGYRLKSSKVGVPWIRNGSRLINRTAISRFPFWVFRREKSESENAEGDWC